MRLIFTLILTLFLSIPLNGQNNDQTSTFYFIRHAEKDRSDASNKNPHLTEEGKTRAQKWSEVLKYVNFDRVYSTEYNRTMETARPTAENNGIDVISIYDPRDMKIESFLEANKGKTVLVVGHSNTTPQFVNNILGTSRFAQIDDSNNGNLYVVTISEKGEKSAQVLYIN